MTDETVKTELIPSFGPLQGVRVLSAGSVIAMPHAANIMADLGAEVIHVERPRVGDTLRGLAPFITSDGQRVSACWAQDARNRLSITLELNLSIPEVREVFLGLVRRADIFMENLVWVEKYGISDELLLETNPQLVIVHCSGYGRPQFGGVPEVCDRASYDMIGQASSGALFLNGDADRPPVVAKPWLNDYLTGLNVAIAALSGYVHAQRTGEGQAIDVSQFESQARILSDTFVLAAESGINRTRTQGSKADAFQPYGLFQDRNGDYVAIGAFGPGVYARFIKAVGFDLDEFSFQDCASSAEAVKSEKGQELARRIVAWVAERTADEVVALLCKAKVACTKVFTAADALADPHWAGRNDFIQYEDQTLNKTITAFGITPKFGATPGQVWRGAPSVGQDTDDVLEKALGMSADQIAAMRDKNYI